MSIMTSLYPSFHGMVDKDSLSPLGDEHITMAELLKKAGYKRIILSADSKEWVKLVRFYEKQGFKVLYTQMMLELK